MSGSAVESKAQRCGESRSGEGPADDARNDHLFDIYACHSGEAVQHV